ncbi:MAG: enoyl-CoA hydratase, partial [Pseudomonadota bacterium]
YLAAAPEAVAASKALVRRLGPQVDEALMQETARRLADTWETESAKEGIAAFFDKRKPAWPGLPG